MERSRRFFLKNQYMKNEDFWIKLIRQFEKNEEFPFKYYGIDGRSAADKCTALDMQNGIYLYSG